MGRHVHKDGNNKHWEFQNWGVKDMDKVWKLPTGDYVHYLGDRFNRSPNSNMMQYIHIT